MSENITSMNLNNARYDDQREVMERVGSDGDCLFCSEQLTKCHTKKILYENKYWLLTYNQWPYENTELHLLAIAKDHINSIFEMKSGSAEALFELLKLAEDQFNIDHGAICMRFGDTRYTGATVGHLHAHLIVSKKNLSFGEKVKFKVGDMPK